MELVYASENGVELLITTREAAEYRQRLCDALNTAKTWGEFREKLPSEELIEQPDFEEMFDEHEVAEPFDPELVCGVGDGDYPPSLIYDMEDLVPDEFLEGYVVSTRLHGDHAQIPMSELPRIKAALEAEGHTLSPL